MKIIFTALLFLYANALRCKYQPIYGLNKDKTIFFGAKINPEAVHLLKSAFGDHPDIKLVEAELEISGLEEKIKKDSKSTELSPEDTKINNLGPLISDIQQLLVDSNSARKYNCTSHID